MNLLANNCKIAWKRRKSYKVDVFEDANKFLMTIMGGRNFLARIRKFVVLANPERSSSEISSYWLELKAFTKRYFDYSIS